MARRKNKKLNRTILNLQDSSKSISLRLKEKDLFDLEKAKELLFTIKEKYSLNFEDIKNFLEEELSLPVSIFNTNLTVLEATVKYLKENKKFSLRKISDLIKRDQRNIWQIYNSSKKKYVEKIIIKEVTFWIPVSIFSDSKLSALENLVSHLKEKLNFNYHEIAVLLSRNDRTIWTVYSRSKKKNVK